MDYAAHSQSDFSCVSILILLIYNNIFLQFLKIYLLSACSHIDKLNFLIHQIIPKHLLVCCWKKLKQKR